MPSSIEEAITQAYNELGPKGPIGTLRHRAEQIAGRTLTQGEFYGTISRLSEQGATEASSHLPSHVPSFSIVATSFEPQGTSAKLCHSFNVYKTITTTTTTTIHDDETQDVILLGHIHFLPKEQRWRYHPSAIRTGRISHHILLEDALDAAIRDFRSCTPELP